MVTKRRQAFRHRGVEVHLDEVDGIGTFLEFEVETKAEEKGTEAFGELLIGLMYALGFGRRPSLKARILACCRRRSVGKRVWKTPANSTSSSGVHKVEAVVDDR